MTTVTTDDPCGWAGQRTQLLSALRGRLPADALLSDAESLHPYECDGLSLCVSTVYDREQWHYPMSSRDPAVRARCREIIAGLVRAATILGADAVLVMPGAVDNGLLAPQREIVPYDVAYRNAVDVLRELGDTACEKHHVYLAAENCPSKFLMSPLEFARFLDEIDNPWVAACFDTGNALWYGYPEHWIPVLGSRIKRVHLKHNRSASNGAVTATPLLAGAAPGRLPPSAVRHRKAGPVYGDAGPSTQQAREAPPGGRGNGQGFVHR